MVGGASGCGLCPWSSSRKVGAYGGILSCISMAMSPESGYVYGHWLYYNTVECSSAALIDSVFHFICPPLR